MKCKHCNIEFDQTRLDKKYCNRKCKDKANSIKNRLKNPEREARYIRKYVCKRYGVTEQQYNDMLVYQNDKCAICHIHYSFFNKKLSIDHNHNNGIVRGLLCNNCNIAIGLLNDDVDRLKSAINYLNNSLFLK